jgi:hypothetical protein
MDPPNNRRDCSSHRVSRQAQRKSFRPVDEREHPGEQALLPRFELWMEVRPVDRSEVSQLEFPEL